MLKSDITNVQLDQWIDEVREEFGDSLAKSMNLIAFDLRKYDDPNTTLSDKYKAYQNLKNWYANDLCRQDKLECEHCGNTLEMYYEPKCFHCEECKPKVKQGKLNLIECMRWVENNEEDYNRDDHWSELCGKDILQGNDSLCRLYNYDSENMTLFMKHFPIDVIYEVSW